MELKDVFSLYEFVLADTFEHCHWMFAFGLLIPPLDYLLNHCPVRDQLMLVDDLSEVIAAHPLPVVCQHGVTIQLKACFRVTELEVAGVLAEDKELDHLQAVEILFLYEFELDIRIEVLAIVVNGFEPRVEGEDVLKPLILVVLKGNNSADADVEEGIQLHRQIDAFRKRSESVCPVDHVPVGHFLAFDQ